MTQRKSSRRKAPEFSPEQSFIARTLNIRMQILQDQKADIYPTSRRNYLFMVRREFPDTYITFWNDRICKLIEGD